MKTIATALALSIAGYAVGALLGAFGVQLFSANAHDKSLETAMTAAFVAGSLGALLALVGFLFSKLSRRRTKA